MKLTTILLLTILSFTTLQAQTITDQAKTITITGESTVQISPNEIILRIEYTEYWATAKKENKIKIKEIEKKVLQTLKTAGVKESNITIGAVRLMRDYDRTRMIYTNRRLSKSLNVCVYHANEMEAIIDVMEAANLFEKAISQFTIASTRHTDKEKFELQAKKEAVANAKEKADLVLSELGKKRGEVLKVMESRASGAQNSGDSFYSSQSTNDSGVSLITVNYKVEVIFVIE